MSEWLTWAVKGHIAAGASNFRMYTKQGGEHFDFNYSYCHVMADLRRSPKQTFLRGLTDMARDGQMTSLLYPKHAGIKYDSKKKPNETKIWTVVVRS